MRSTIILALACATTPIAAFAQAQAVAPRSKVVVGTPVAGSAGTLSTSANPFLALSASMANEPRIELDLDNTPIRNALQQVFERAKQSYKVDDDVPDSPRITVRAKNVRLSTALELLLQDARIGVIRQLENGKLVYRIQKSGPDTLSAIDLLRSTVGSNIGMGLSALQHAAPPHLANPEVRGSIQINPKHLEQYLYSLQMSPMGTPHGSAVPYVLSMREQRSMFQCPHCKGQATVIRKDEQVKCEKCTRPFQSGWQFCPADGTKRPAARSEWKYCPFCSKKVDGEKGAGVPFLEDLPFVGSLFRSAPAPVAVPPALQAPGDVPQPTVPDPVRALPAETAAPAKRVN